MKAYLQCRRRLLIEKLEDRTVLSVFAGVEAPAAVLSDLIADGAEIVPVLQAGLRYSLQPDTPTRRVDPNSATSPFAGVGSLRIISTEFIAGCTGSLISPTHVLTAAHCLDHDSDGDASEVLFVEFTLNAGAPREVDAVSWSIHPDFTGFQTLSISDDVAVITLDPDDPEMPFTNVTPYGLYSQPLAPSTTLYMAGYGQSGDGLGSLLHFLFNPVSFGYYVQSSPTVKRVGGNTADMFLGQDDILRPQVDEIFVFDFDGPSGNGLLGGGTLGNRTETQLAFGDSGGPSFVLDDGVLKIAGVNTFAAGFPPSAFGAIGGGMLVSAYSGWIEDVKKGVTSSTVAASKDKGPTGVLHVSSAIRVLAETAAANSVAFALPPTMTAGNTELPETERPQRLRSDASERETASIAVDTTYAYESRPAVRHELTENDDWESLFRASSKSKIFGDTDVMDILALEHGRVALALR